MSDALEQDRQKRRWVTRIAVFLAALIILGFGFERPSIGNAVPDPVSKYRAQDAALYSHIALTMAQSGDWLTPHYLGRLLLYKPPLLTWLAGISVKTWGTSLFSLRLPVLLAGALGVILVFVWPRSLLAGTLAALLMVSDFYWHTFSRVCQTDAMHTAFLTGAMLCLASDPKLSRRSSFCTFALLSALSIMVKSVSGLAAPLGLLFYCVMARQGERPSKGRLATLFVAIAALAVPWHIYQLAVHARWFWADYVQYQLLGYGLRPLKQVAGDGAVMFYLRRLWAGDPVLCLLAALAIPWFVKEAWRRTSSHTVTLAAWMAAVLTGLLLFQYHSVHYLISLVPPLCLIAGGYGPLARGRAGVAVCVALCAVFIGKVTYAGTWQLAYGRETPNPVIGVLKDYYAKNRANGLVLVQPDDNLYAPTLPNLDVRYCFIDPWGTYGFPWHFRYLGVALTSAQYIESGTSQAPYAQRLSDWGVTSHQPIGSVIIALRDQDVSKLIRFRPGYDYLLPTRLRETATEAAQSTHDLVPAKADKLLLLSRERIPGSHLKLPRYW